MSGVGNFMRNKRVKLQVQYRARLAEVGDGGAPPPPQIFRGLAFYVRSATRWYTIFTPES